MGGALWFLVAVDNKNVWFPQSALAVMAGLAAVVALAWTGRAARLAGLGLGVYLYVFWLVLPPTSPVAIVMFSVPGFLAGTVLRQRRETVDQLAGAGRGLTGLRERVQALGGQLLAGPTPRGGWLVEATLPS